MIENYDVVVIGAGSGGLTAAVGLAKVGKKVLLVEREHIGGECTNSGCIPSKALLHHAKTYATAIKIAGANGNTQNYRRNAFSYARSKINETLAHETPEHFKKIGIDILNGEAIFTSPSTIVVGSDTINFKKAVIATGSSPKMINVPGLDTTKVLTNQNLFSLESAPARTLIIGAGPIGLEMGQALAMLGSTITILDNGPTFSRLEDPSIQPIIKQACLDLGITIIQNASLKNVAGGVAIVEQQAITYPHHIPFDKILIAIGRVPNIPKGLEVANIKSSSVGIQVNKNYLTSNKRVYAIGDVADLLKFTHVADDTARGVVTHIATKGLVGLKTKAIPKVTYTSPELAQVGLSQTEAELRYKPHNIHRIAVPFNQNDRARTDNDESGVLVVLVKRLSGKIIGVHIAGPRAGELIAIFTLAIDNNLSLWKLRRTIYAYPTYALIIKKAGDYFFATQIGTLKSDLVTKMKTILPKLLLVSFWIIGLILLYRYQHTNNLTVTDTTLSLFTFISASTVGPLIYIAAYTIRPITFLPATALTILSGVFFGLYDGIIYTIIGANLSATLAYFIGRFFGGETLNLNTGLFGRFAESCRTRPFITILTMRLLFLPYDAVNYGAGFLKIPYLSYLMATIVGTILGIITFVSIGAALSITEVTKNGITAATIDSTFLFISAGIFITSLVLSKILKRYY